MQRAGGKVFLRVWHCHPAGFGRVFELVMAAVTSSQPSALSIRITSALFMMCGIHTAMKAANLPFHRPALAGRQHPEIFPPQCLALASGSDFGLTAYRVLTRPRVGARHASRCPSSTSRSSPAITRF